MKDPNAEILSCDICEEPVGDDKMMEAHEKSKNHKLKAFQKLAGEQAKDILTGAWHNRVSHREYWYAMGLWTEPTNPYFGDVDRAGQDYYVPKYFSDGR